MARLPVALNRTRMKGAVSTRPPLHGDRPPASGNTESAQARSSLIVPAVAVAGFVVLVVILYSSARHAFAGDSDGATVVLQGHSLDSGNVTLHGWALSLDSFWTVDAVVYMLVELLTGVRDMLLFLVPAIIGASVVVVGALLARDRRRGIPGMAAVATVVVVLALPSHALATVFLRGPLHVGTALLCLCAFAGLRSGRFGWGWVAAVVCLAAGLLGDFLTMAFGVAAVCTAGIVAMLRGRDWRWGAPEVGAAAASLVLAAVVRTVAEVVGTFSVSAGHPRASWPQMLTNLGRVAPWSASMLGVGSGRVGNGGVPAGLTAVHVIGLIVVTGGVVAGTAALVRGVIRGKAFPRRASSPAEAGTPWRLDDLLVAGVFTDLGVFVVLTTSDDPGFLRYLTPAVIFATILAGRWVGRLVASLPSEVPVKRGALTVSLVGAAAFTAAFGFTLAAPIPRQPYAHLDTFLEHRHLNAGIGDYWSASIVTVATDGGVTVRPVISTRAGHVVRYRRQSAATWYAERRFQFLVYDTARPWGGVDAASASSTFGPVARTYVVGAYRVLVWRHPLFVAPTRPPSGIRAAARGARADPHR